MSLRLNRLCLPNARYDVQLHTLEERLESLEVSARNALRDLLGLAPLLAASNVPQRREICLAMRFLKFRKQRIIVDLIVLRRRDDVAVQQPLPIEWVEQGAALGSCTHPIEPHGEETLKDVAVLAVLRRVRVLVEETLDIFEARNDALLARRTPALLLLGRKLGKLGCKFFDIEIAQ